MVEKSTIYVFENSPQTVVPKKFTISKANLFPTVNQNFPWKCPSQDNNVVKVWAEKSSGEEKKGASVNVNSRRRWRIYETNCLPKLNNKATSFALWNKRDFPERITSEAFDPLRWSFMCRLLPTHVFGLQRRCSSSSIKAAASLQPRQARAQSYFLISRASLFPTFIAFACFLFITVASPRQRGKEEIALWKLREYLPISSDFEGEMCQLLNGEKGKISPESFT